MEIGKLPVILSIIVIAAICSTDWWLPLIKATKKYDGQKWTAYIGNTQEPPLVISNKDDGQTIVVKAEGEGKLQICRTFSNGQEECIPFAEQQYSEDLRLFLETARRKQRFTKDVWETAVRRVLQNFNLEP